MTHSRIAALAVPLVGLLALAACHPGDVGNVSELDLVVTNNDKSVDFGSFATYALPDTVFDLADLIEDGGEDWNGEFDAHILAEFVRNIEARGYARVAPEIVGGEPTWPQGEPDLLAVIGGLKTKGYLYSYWWGGGYPWYPGWGYYPPYPSVYEYEQGTIVVNLLDYQSRDEDAEVFAGVWQAVLNGVASGSSSTSIRGRITSGMNQAFTQSPYLAAD